MGGQRVIALMGAEVNHWVNKQGRFYLRSKDYIKNFEAAFGASRTLPGMDGPEQPQDAQVPAECLFPRFACGKAAGAHQPLQEWHKPMEGRGRVRSGRDLSELRQQPGLPSIDRSELQPFRRRSARLRAPCPHPARSRGRAELHDVDAEDEAREKTRFDTSACDPLVAHTCAEARQTAGSRRRHTRTASERSTVSARNGHRVPICRINGGQHLFGQFARLRGLRHGSQSESLRGGPSGGRRPVRKRSRTAGKGFQPREHGRNAPTVSGIRTHVPP